MECKNSGGRYGKALKLRTSEADHLHLDPRPASRHARLTVSDNPSNRKDLTTCNVDDGAEYT
jgi:hypothetical protein